VKIFRDKTFGLIPPRTIVLITMLASPLLVYAVFAALAIWQLGWMKWLWWLAPLIWSITWLLSRFWPADKTPELAQLEAEHWTSRDRQAVEIVRRYQQETEFFNGDQLSDPRFYFNQGLKIAQDIARHYDPETPDPVSQRTLPEILAACRLVADDLEQIVLTSVPGSRLLTVSHWKKLGDAPKVVRQLSKGFWATSFLLNPLSLASWGTSKVTNEKVTNDLQTELLITLYMRFVRQLGYYLIEMNSGRLRGGADLYRSTFSRKLREQDLKLPAEDRTVDGNREVGLSGNSRPGSQHHGGRSGEPAATGSNPVQSEVATPVTTAGRDSSVQVMQGSRLPPLKIVVMGQRGSGKTQLVNVFRGIANQADPPVATRFGLATRSVKRHRFYSRQLGTEIELIDTPGYDSSDLQPTRGWRAKNELINGIRLAAAEANAILLILKVGEIHLASDRAADRALLEGVRDSYARRAHLKPPAVIAVLVFPSWEGGGLSEVPSTGRQLPKKNSSGEKLTGENRAVNRSLSVDSGKEGSPAGIDRQPPAPAELFEGFTVSQWVEQTWACFGELIDEVAPLFHDLGDDSGQRSVEDSLIENLLPRLQRQWSAIQSAARLVAYEESLNRARYRTLLTQAKNSGQKLLSSWLDARENRRGKP
jgi:energy-coupling factor transporter ATP-binding protein EcfA2